MPHSLRPLVVISAASPHQIADWSIPYKAGLLNFHATDRATGKAISGVCLDLAVRGSEDLRWMESCSAAGIPTLLPPDEDVYVTIRARGYTPWPVGEQGGRLVDVQPGMTLDLSVIMEPATGVPLDPQGRIPGRRKDRKH